MLDRCRIEEPELRRAEDGHFAACDLHDLPAAQNPMASNRDGSNSAPIN